MDKTTHPRAFIGHLMALGAILIFSFNTNFMKIVMPTWIGPEGLVLLRCAMSAVGFWIIGLFMPRSAKGNASGKEILMIMLGGALGLAGNLLVYIRGLSMTGPVDAFVIRTVQPIIVIAMGVIFLHAVFTRYKAIGIALGLAGTLYVSLMPHTGPVKDSLSGDLLIFCSAIFNALFLVLIKPYTMKYNSIFVMKWMSLAAFIITLPFGIKQVIHAPFLSAGTPVHIWLEIGYTLVFATMVAYFLNVKALNYISAFTESVYIYLLPVTGAAVSIMLGLQKFSWHDPIALALIIAGFILINKKKKVKKQNIPATELSDRQTPASGQPPQLYHGH